MAIAGLEVNNADGTLRNGVTDKLSRIVGTMTVGGNGPLTMNWPYPNIPGNRAVYAVSNLAPQDNVFSNAYAIMDANGVITYGQEGDRRPITLIFFVY